MPDNDFGKDEFDKEDGGDENEEGEGEENPFDLDKLKGNAWLVATHLLFTLIPGLEF
jgi:hypothetical protein